MHSANQQLVGTSNGNREAPDQDFVYTVQENPNVTEAREAFVKRETERIAEVGKARKAIPATNVPVDFKAVVARLKFCGAMSTYYGSSKANCKRRSTGSSTKWRTLPASAHSCRSD